MGSTLQVTMTDMENQVQMIKIGITVWNNEWWTSGIQAIGNGAKTIEKIIGGGNLVVH